MPILPVSLNLCLAVLLLTNPWNVTYRVAVVGGGGAASMVLGPGESTLIPVAVSAPLTVVFRGLGGLPSGTAVAEVDEATATATLLPPEPLHSGTGGGGVGGSRCPCGLLLLLLAAVGAAVLAARGGGGDREGWIARRGAGGAL